jgi:uncharacterized membrane protein YgaE (UPF0421/DUF939 family)
MKPKANTISGSGIIWAAIISIPFWFIVLRLIIAGVITVKILILVGLAFSALLLFLILTPSRKTKRDEQDWDEFIKNIAAPTIQLKTHTQDPSATHTPA